MPSTTALDGNALERLRFPRGRYQFEADVTPARREEWLTILTDTPTALEGALAGLTPTQLATPYRPEGWTVTQVAHHLADSHLNAVIRTRLALTEETPSIKTYFEDRWAELPDATSMPVAVSVALLHTLHQRWVFLLRSLTTEQWSRTLFHPEHNRTLSLDNLIGLYAWHGPHHVAQITALRARLGLPPGTAPAQHPG